MQNLTASQNSCDDTVFREQWRLFFQARSTALSEKQYFAQLKIASISRYLNVLRSQKKTDNCATSAQYEQKSLTYKGILFTDAFAVPFVAKCEDWCAVGSFNYQAYESQYRSLIPCAPT